jgi:hypothetical protein
MPSPILQTCPSNRIEEKYKDKTDFHPKPGKKCSFDAPGLEVVAP